MLSFLEVLLNPRYIAHSDEKRFFLVSQLRTYSGRLMYFTHLVLFISGKYPTK